MAVPILLYILFPTGIAPKHLPSDGVRASFLAFVTVSNGVKQGGVLSPNLFNVYMDDLSVNLNNLQIGCLYADILSNQPLDVC